MKRYVQIENKYKCHGRLIHKGRKVMEVDADILA